MTTQFPPLFSPEFPENRNPRFHLNVGAWEDRFGDLVVLMDNLLGLLSIRVKKGIHLAVRDFISSDPYVVITMGEQRLKTRVIDGDLNPVWDEDLTLPIENPDLPIHLMVYDHDIFSRDDEMGDADFDIKAFHETRKTHMGSNSITNGTVLKKIEPDGSNCLSKESCIMWQDKKIVQDMTLKLRNVECGEVELELHWIDLPGVQSN